MEMRVSEENVVQQIKRKNEDSIPFILKTYGGLLNAIIRKYLHSNQRDIEECLADVLVSIWFQIHSFDPEKNEFKKWIAAIAKYRAIDYVRRLEREKKYVSEEEMSEQVSGRQESELILSDVEGLLKELSPVERTIFEKYYVEGMPSRELAQHFQAKESWVHNKLSRGRKRLRSILLKNGV